jgi:hypothetical protein
VRLGRGDSRAFGGPHLLPRNPDSFRQQVDAGLQKLGISQGPPGSLRESRGPRGSPRWGDGAPGDLGQAVCGWA